MWLREAALHLDKDDEDITEHVGPVLADVTQNIQVRFATARTLGSLLPIVQTSADSYTPEQHKAAKIVNMMLSGL